MGRHANHADARPGLLRLAALALVWAAGLAAGFYALLGVAAHYTTCSSHATGLACRSAGTVVGAVLAVAVIAIVTTVTTVTHARGPRLIAAATAFGILALAACFLGARALVGTI